MSPSLYVVANATFCGTARAIGKGTRIMPMQSDHGGSKDYLLQLQMSLIKYRHVCMAGVKSKTKRVYLCRVHGR